MSTQDPNLMPYPSAYPPFPDFPRLNSIPLALGIDRVNGTPARGLDFSVPTPPASPVE